MASHTLHILSEPSVAFRISRDVNATSLSYHLAVTVKASPLGGSFLCGKNIGLHEKRVPAHFHARKLNRDISRHCRHAITAFSLTNPSQPSPSSDSDIPYPTPPSHSKTETLSLFARFTSFLKSSIQQPLSNFGFGKRSLWEGGVGLFLLTGSLMLALLVSWVKGFQANSRSTRYHTVMEFSQACGITVGTPVRIRGVEVGSVVAVRPSLERIDVVAEILDAGTVIPRNALVEVNQSGLISETLIDVTPRRPIPSPRVGPLSPDCESEGVIVCDRQRIIGKQGVSLDELVGVCTKLAKQMDAQGLDTAFDAMTKVSEAVEDARPLLEKVTQISTDLQPLMKDLSDGELLKNLEGLTKVMTEAAKDLRQLNNSVLTEENTNLLRESVSTMTKTLKHVENISEDLSGLTGDPDTRSNLKQLIESLSRLVND